MYIYTKDLWIRFVIVKVAELLSRPNEYFIKASSAAKKSLF